MCGEVSTRVVLQCAEVCAGAHVVRHACSRTHMQLAEQPGCAHVVSVGSPKHNKGRAYGSAAACANASTEEQHAKYFHGLTHDKLVCLFHWLVLHVPVRGLKALGLLLGLVWVTLHYLSALFAQGLARLWKLYIGTTFPVMLCITLL